MNKNKKLLIKSMTIAIATILSNAKVYALEQTTADQVAGKVETIIKTYVIPFVGVLAFGALVVCGIMIIINANKPKERAEHMSAIMWIAIGSGIIGMASLIAGLIMNIVK